MGQLSVQFRLDAGPVFSLLSRAGLAVDPSVLSAIVAEEGQAFVKRAHEILASDQGKFPQIVTGNLYNSVRFDVVRSSRGSLKGKFWVDCPYASAVEFKTPRRRNPPTLREIIAWKRRKEPSEGIEGAIRAWRYIKKHGVQNHPFFWPAYRQMKSTVMTNIGRRVLQIWRSGGAGIVTRVRGPLWRIKRRSVTASLRSTLYDWAKFLGWMQALGLDVSSMRAFMYGAARSIGDVTAVSGGSLAGRMYRRGLGSVTSLGLGASVPRVDPLVGRALRVSGGRLAGARLRGWER